MRSLELKASPVPENVDDHELVRPAKARYETALRRLAENDQRTRELDEELSSVSSTGWGSVKPIEDGKRELDEAAAKILAGEELANVPLAARTEQLRAEFNRCASLRRPLQRAAELGRDELVKARHRASEEILATVGPQYRAIVERLADAIVEFRRAILEERGFRETLNAGGWRVFPSLRPMALAGTWISSDKQYPDRCQLWVQEAVQYGLLDAEYLEEAEIEAARVDKPEPYREPARAPIEVEEDPNSFAFIGG